MSETEEEKTARLRRLVVDYCDGKIWTDLDCRTALGTILGCLGKPKRPRVEQPALLEHPTAVELLAKPSIQPRLMRKGKSGEIRNRGSNR